MNSSKRKAPAKAPATTPPTPNVRKGNGAAPTPAIAAQPFGGATDNYSLRLATLMIEAVKAAAAQANVTPPTVVRAAVEMFMALPPSIRGAKLAEMALRVPTKPLVRIIACKAVRLTDTEPILEDTEHPDSAHRVEGKGRYALRCTTHGTVRHDPNREHAMGVLGTPWKWCGGCKDLMMEDATS